MNSQFAMFFKPSTSFPRFSYDADTSKALFLFNEETVKLSSGASRTLISLNSGSNISRITGRRYSWAESLLVLNSHMLVPIAFTIESQRARRLPEAGILVLFHLAEPYNTWIL